MDEPWLREFVRERASLNRLNDEGAPESIAWGQSNQPVIALLLALLRSKPNGGDNG